MNHKAIVLSTEGEYAQVSVLREEACAHCAGRVVCGTAKCLTVKAKNPISAKSGDTVVIERSDKSVLGYSALVFLAPVALAVALYLIFLNISELAGGIAAAIGFILPFPCAIVIDRFGRDARLPVITETVSAEKENAPCDAPDAEL